MSKDSFIDDEENDNFVDDISHIEFEVLETETVLGTSTSMLITSHSKS